MYWKSIITLLLICLWIGQDVEAILPHHRLRDPVAWHGRTVGGGLQSDQRASAEQQYKWKEEWYEKMPVDHFSFNDSRTFPLRYFINTDHTVANGPIFFYTGNEGSLEGFAVNTVSVGW